MENKTAIGSGEIFGSFLKGLGKTGQRQRKMNADERGHAIKRGRPGTRRTDQKKNDK